MEAMSEPQTKAQKLQHVALVPTDYATLCELDEEAEPHLGELEKAKGYSPDTLADDLHMKQLCSLCSEFVNQHTRDESIGPLEQDIDGKSWDSDGTTLTWGFIPPEGLDDDTRGPDIEEPFAKTQEINGPVVETRVDEMFEDSSWESIFANILQGDQGEEIDVDEPIV